MLYNTTNQLEKKSLINTVEQLKNQLAQLQKGRLKNLGAGEGELRRNRSIKEAAQQEVRILENSKQRIKNSLREIYAHYCKVSDSEKVGRTFDDLLVDTSFLNMHKFFLFCRDFNVFSMLNRETLIGIFKKCSQNQIVMNLKGFEDSVVLLGQKVFQNVADSEKKIHELLELGDAALVRRRMAASRALAHPPGSNSSANSTTAAEQVNSGQPSSGSNSQQSSDLSRNPTFASRYKFQIHAHSGKTKEEIREELERRRGLREQEKQKQLKNYSQMHESKQLKYMKYREKHYRSRTMIDSTSNEISRKQLQQQHSGDKPGEEPQEVVPRLDKVTWNDLNDERITTQFDENEFASEEEKISHNDEPSAFENSVSRDLRTFHQQYPQQIQLQQHARGRGQSLQEHQNP